MKRAFFFLVFLIVASGPLKAESNEFETTNILEERYPRMNIAEIQIAIACAWDPYPSARRANGFDCSARHAVRRARFVYHTHMSDIEVMRLRHESYARLNYEAVQACGGGCNAFYGSLGGYQCLAVAQNAYYTGLGAFTGKETTQADAERTALRNCQEFVGQPGRPCEIIVSACPRPSSNP